MTQLYTMLFWPAAAAKGNVLVTGASRLGED